MVSINSCSCCLRLLHEFIFLFNVIGYGVTLFNLTPWTIHEPSGKQSHVSRSQELLPSAIDEKRPYHCVPWSSLVAKNFFCRQLYTWLGFPSRSREALRLMGFFPAGDGLKFSSSKVLSFHYSVRITHGSLGNFTTFILSNKGG